MLKRVMRCSRDSASMHCRHRAMPGPQAIPDRPTHTPEASGALVSRPNVTGEVPGRHLAALISNHAAPIM